MSRKKRKGSGPNDVHLVGEEGPELLVPNKKGGFTVIPAGPTMTIMKGRMMPHEDGGELTFGDMNTLGMMSKHPGSTTRRLFENSIRKTMLGPSIDDKITLNPTTGLAQEPKKSNFSNEITIGKISLINPKGEEPTGSILFHRGGGEIPAPQKKVEKVMGEFKQGKLKSGGSGNKVTDRKQAIAITMNEAGISKHADGGEIQLQGPYAGAIRANAGKNFVQRMMTPSSYPRIDNPDGSYNTHLMTSADNIAFPMVVQHPDGNLQRFEPNQWRDAYDHAMRTGEYIEFPSGSQASDFSANYKSAFPKGHFNLVPHATGGEINPPDTSTWSGWLRSMNPFATVSDALSASNAQVQKQQQVQQRRMEGIPVSEPYKSPPNPPDVIPHAKGGTIRCHQEGGTIQSPSLLEKETGGNIYNEPEIQPGARGIPDSAIDNLRGSFNARTADAATFGGAVPVAAQPQAEAPKPQSTITGRAVPTPPTYIPPVTPGNAYQILGRTPSGGHNMEVINGTQRSVLSFGPNGGVPFETVIDLGDRPSPGKIAIVKGEEQERARQGKIQEELVKAGSKSLTAEQLVHGALREELGREPTNQEILSRMTANAAEIAGTKRPPNKLDIWLKSAEEKKGSPLTAAERKEVQTSHEFYEKTGIEDPNDIESMLQAVANDKLSINDLSKRSAFHTRLVSELTKRYPDLNLAKAVEMHKYRSTEGYHAAQTALEALPVSLEGVVKAGTGLNFPKLKTAASINAWVDEQMGDPRFTKYLTFRNDAIQNVARVMRGGAATDMAQKLEERTIPVPLNPQALYSWYEAQMEALAPRMKRYQLEAPKIKSFDELSGKTAKTENPKDEWAGFWK